MIRIVAKNEVGTITRNLYYPEFKCKCDYDGCTSTTIYMPTARSFQHLRNALGVALTVTSAFRCQRWNSDVGGSNTSSHKLGGALDILRPESVDFSRFVATANIMFDIVVPYEKDNFIHCHNIVY